MNPDALIESYVGDVVRHLPRSQRNDVAFELRSLLREELEGRAADTGRDADAAMTLQLLSAFGRPADVADRYRPAGFTVIRASEAPRFARVALGGVVVQWVLSLVTVFSEPSTIEWLSRLGAWWLTWGLGAFWWPGLLISVSLIASYAGSRRRDAGEWMPTRVVVRDRDQVRRPLFVFYIALGVLGASIVSTLPVWSTQLSAPLVDAFRLDAEFLSWRAPWVLVLWAALLAVAIAVLIIGRWNTVARRLSLAVSIAWLALLVWWIAAGPIFVSDYTDEVTKLCLVVVAALSGIDLIVTIVRWTRRIRVPAGA
jgi:hypothetical protein